MALRKPDNNQFSNWKQFLTVCISHVNKTETKKVRENKRRYKHMGIKAAVKQN